MSDTPLEEVALFPLQTVLFPGGQLPLRLFEQRYLEMAKTCLREDRPFGVCRIREGQEVGEPATPEAVGCLAHIAHWDMVQLGVLNIVARGAQRFRILERRIERDGLARASIVRLPEVVDAPVAAPLRDCVTVLEALLERSGAPSPEAAGTSSTLDSSAWVSARLAEQLPLPLELKQALLELDDGAARLARLREALVALRVLPAQAPTAPGWLDSAGSA